MKHLICTLSLLTSASLHADPALHVSTSDIRPESNYQLVFDNAVIPPDAVNTTTKNDYLEIKPKLKGELHWTAQNIANFIPSEAPHMGTEYTFSIKPKRKHLDDTPIPSAEIKTLSSEAFRPTYHRKSYVNNRLPISYIRFNDDVSPDKISKYFHYLDKEGNKQDVLVRQATWKDLESTYYIRPSWQQRFQNHKTRLAGGEVESRANLENDTPITNGVIITPKKPLEIGKEWNLIVKQGLPNKSSDYHLAKAQNYYIWDIKPFKLHRVVTIVRPDYPRELWIDFNNKLPDKLSPEELANLITITPKPPKLKLEKDGSSSITATGDFNQASKFTVTVSEDLVAANGLPLEVSQVKEVTFHNVASGIGLPSFNTAQLSKGTRKYSIDTVNMRQVRVRVKSLSPLELIRAEQGYRHYTGNGHNYSSISPTHTLPFELIGGQTIYDKVIQLDNGLNTSKRVELDWNEILPAEMKSASMFISVVGEPKQQLNRKEALKREAQAVIQLTDLGIAWKVADGHLWAYTYSLETGEPVPSATVALYGEDAKLLKTAKTNELGMVKLDRSPEERHLIASNGDDHCAITFDSTLANVRMWNFPVNFSWSAEKDWQRDLMVFTDRNLYRPGEKVRFKAILREYLDNHLRIPESQAVTVKLCDPKRKVLVEQEITVSDNGTFDAAFDLPLEKVGRYSIECMLANDDTGEQANHLRSHFLHYFSVQDFRRNAFEITSNLPSPKPGDENIQLDLTAQYYQGTPVADGKVNWYFTATSTGFYPDKFRDYHFGDHREYDPYYWSYYFGYNDRSDHYQDSEHKNGSLSLSPDGTASVSLDIPKQDFPTAQRLSFTSEVTDARDQTLTNVREVTQHPASLYYGIARHDHIIRVDKPLDINLVAVGLDGMQLEKDCAVKVSLQRSYHETVRVKAKDGTVRVHNEKKTEDISSENFMIQAGKASPYPFTPEKPGNYTIKVSGIDANGRAAASATTFYVYGSNVYPWATEDGMRIKLVSAEKSYKPGDTAKLLVMTPIEGTALVTIERMGVMKTFRRQLSMDNPVLEFPVDASMAPNAYVSVLLIRGSANSPHKHKQPVLKLGYCNLTVTDPAKELTVALEIPGSSHRPSEEVLVKGTVTDNLGNPVPNSEVVLFAEDEGTLAVMGYSTPKPLDYFHDEIPLTLQTGVSLGALMSENPLDLYYGNKGFTIGGGGEFGSMDYANNIKARHNFDPCAAWFPTVVTDSQGTFSVRFTTPDTLTRYRVMATALSGADRFGSTSKDLIVSKNIMLEPKTPRFAYEGDNMTQRVVVQNASQVSGTWHVSLTADSLTEIIGGTGNTLSKTVSLNANEQTTVSFDVSFKNTGETTWTWKATPQQLDGIELTSATRKDYSDVMVSKFDVTYPRPLLRHANFIRFEDGNTEQINLVSNVNPIIMNGRGHADLEFSNSLLLEAGGAVDYLLQYPYGCVEQTTSSLMPWFAVRDLRSVVPGFAATSEGEVITAIQKGADRLLSMQTSSGGLSYWPGNEQATDWATVYGGMGILLAKEHGANVPDSTIDGITSYLADLLRTPKDDRYRSWHTDTDCRALYVLALAGKPQHAYQNKFYDERKDLGTSSRAFLALAIHHSGGDKAQAITLLTEPVKENKDQYWMRYRADTPAHLLAWSTINPDGDEADQTLEKLLSQRNSQGHWHTTWVNGWSLHAMASYARNVEKNRQPATVTLHLDSGTKTITLDKNKPVQSIRLPLSEARNLHTSSNHKAFSRVVISSKPEVAPSGPMGKDGLAITRSYQRITAEGKTEPLENPRVGDLVLVTLEVTFSEELRYVSIDDPLPSTFEAINEEFATQTSFFKNEKNWRVSRTELRNDRALFFLNKSWRGSSDTVSYLARITAEGDVHAPPAKVEAMYDPNKFALTSATTIKSSRE